MFLRAKVISRAARAACAITVIVILYAQNTKAGSLFGDPLNAEVGVPPTPTKNLLEPGSNCRIDGPLPKPLTLLDAVERALCTDPQTRQSWADVRTQAALVGMSRGAYLPNVSLSGTYYDLNQRVQYPGLPVLDTRFSTRSSDVPLSLNWVLYDFGARAANARYAHELFTSALSTQDAALQSVFLRAGQAFFRAQGAQALRDASLEAERVAEQSFKSAEAMASARIGTLADQLQAQTSYAQATLRRVQTTGDLMVSRGQLAITIGASPDESIELADSSREFPDYPVFHEAVESLIAQAIRAHPTILAARAQLAAALAHIDSVRAKGLATISLIAGAEYMSTPLTASLQQNFTNTTVGLQVKVPLFEGLQRAYELREARAQADSKSADVDSAQRQVAFEVWKSYQMLQMAIDRMRAIDLLAQSAKKSLEAAQVQYKSGFGSIFELLRAQSDLAYAGQERATAYADWQSTRLQLIASVASLSIEDVR